MNQAVLLALLLKKVESRLEDQPLVSGHRGPRGYQGIPGKDGKDFSIEEHEARLKSWSQEFALKFEDFTEEQIKALRGPRGRDGNDGRDGKNGKDFSLEENQVYLESLAARFAIKFEDFTAEQIGLLRGPQGREGRDGKDFIWDDNSDKIRDLINSLIVTCSETLRLKFTDLTVDEIETIRGPRGREGRDGKDFNFEDHREEIRALMPKFSDFTAEEIDQLRLHFRDLEEQEKESLKLKFSDLSDEERALLRGSRGPRGQRGYVGEKGDTVVGPRGLRGVPGPIGMMGIRGRDGNDGRDGIDAPHVVDVAVEKIDDRIEFKFHFSNGQAIEASCPVWKL